MNIRALWSTQHLTTWSSSQSSSFKTRVCTRFSGRRTRRRLSRSTFSTAMARHSTVWMVYSPLMRKRTWSGTRLEKCTSAPMATSLLVYKCMPSTKRAREECTNCVRLRLPVACLTNSQICCPSEQSLQTKLQPTSKTKWASTSTSTLAMMRSSWASRATLMLRESPHSALSSGSRRRTNDHKNRLEISALPESLLTTKWKDALFFFN